MIIPGVFPIKPSILPGLCDGHIIIAVESGEIRAAILVCQKVSFSMPLPIDKPIQDFPCFFRLHIVTEQPGVKDIFTSKCHAVCHIPPNNRFYSFLTEPEAI